MAIDDPDFLHEKNQPQAAGESGEKSSRLPFIIFLLLSPVIIFGTVYFSNKMVMEKKAAQFAADSLLAVRTLAADSLIMTQDSLPSAAEITVPDEQAPDLLRSEEMYEQFLADTLDARMADQKAQMAILQRFGEMNRIIRQQNQELSELKQMRAEREETQEQLSRLAEKSRTQEENIQSLEEDMPKRILDMLREYQEDRDARVAKVTEEKLMTEEELNAEHERRIGKIAKIYEAMKSDKAALILARLTDEEIKNILLKMRQRNAAKILAEFEPALSARISRLMGKEV